MVHAYIWSHHQYPYNGSMSPQRETICHTWSFEIWQDSSKFQHRAKLLEAIKLLCIWAHSFLIITEGRTVPSRSSSVLHYEFEKTKQVPFPEKSNKMSNSKIKDLLWFGQEQASRQSSSQNYINEYFQQKKSQQHYEITYCPDPNSVERMWNQKPAGKTSPTNPLKLHIWGVTSQVPPMHSLWHWH